MWNHLYQLWRSVLVAGPAPGPAEPPLDEAPREALQEELLRLLEEREHLRLTSLSYREFGFDEPAGRVRPRLLAVDRRIGEIRVHLRRRRTAATGR